MSLTDTALRAVKPADKPLKLFDGNGLFLLVSPSGTKAWRFKYHFQGREKLISLGLYPTVTMKDARERAAAARRSLANGIDPSEQRKQEKTAYQNTFELVAMEWHEQQSSKWSEVYSKTNLSRMKRNLFPAIGSKPVNAVSAPELLAILRKIEAQGTRDIAHCVLTISSCVFRYAIATGRAERDPAADLRGALAPRVRRNLPSQTTPEAVGNLLIALDNYPGTLVVRSALRLMALTFCRTGELRGAEWREIDFDDALWRIPAERMKMSRDHLIPLSRQSIAILRTMHKYSGNDVYVFPNYKTEKRSMSKSALLGAIRRLGFDTDEMCPHGFRSMASTMLNELGYNGDWIERQLAHVPRNIIRGIYNRAEYLPERRKMLQEWADYLDALREKARQESMQT
jgi:integrase